MSVSRDSYRETLRQCVLANDTRSILHLAESPSIDPIDLCESYVLAARNQKIDVMAAIYRYVYWHYGGEIDKKTLSHAFEDGMTKGDLSVCLLALAHGHEPDTSTMKLCALSLSMDHADKLKLYEEITSKFKGNPYVCACQHALAVAKITRNLPLFQHLARICGHATRRERFPDRYSIGEMEQPYIDALIKTTARRKFAATLAVVPFAFHPRIKMRMRAVDAATAMVQLGKCRSRVIGGNGRDVLRLVGRLVLSTWTDEEAWGDDDNCW